MAETRNDPKLKEFIINKTLELMSENGVGGTSLKQVAEACCISRGTLYYYFKSKDELILQINQWNMNRITSTLLGLLDGFLREGKSPGEIVLEIFKSVSGAELRGRMHFYLINEAMTSNPALIAPLRESYREWFRIIENSFTRFLPESSDREAVARSLVAALDGIIIQKFLSLNDISLKRIVDIETKGYGG